MSDVTPISLTWPHPGASVSVAGTFNDWNPQPMAKEDEGVFVFRASVPRGSHQFKFVVDGEWVHDEQQDFVANEMGSFNNVIEVAESETDSSSHCSSSPKKTTSIEVERKFLVPDNYKDLLSSHGFRLVKGFEEAIVDEYYDTPAFDLLERNHWLRRRNGDWELKYPVGKDSEYKDNQVYHETSNPEDILQRLSVTHPPARSLFESSSLTCYAHLDTRRWCYQRDEVSVVIDVADWGYRVGEIEVMVQRREDVKEATKRIQGIAEDLGLKPTRTGKLIEYLRVRNREAYDKVVVGLKDD